MTIKQNLTFRKVDELLALSRKAENGVEVGFEGPNYPNKKVGPAEVALFNEFGHNNGPARPFFRTAFKKRANHINLIRWVGRKIIRGEITMREALDLLGEEAVESVKQSIRDYDDPPNAPSTVRKKGFNNPLIDSGLMLNSVKYKRRHNV